MRKPYQVLIFPFIKRNNNFYYAIFKRRDMGIWQGIAGGGEKGESPLKTAKRELYEETKIKNDNGFISLSSITTIPAANIHGIIWGKEIIMVPEFSFGACVFQENIEIGKEHDKYLWLNLKEASKKVKYDSNRSALWELDYRLKNKQSKKEINKNKTTILSYLRK